MTDTEQSDTLKTYLSAWLAGYLAGGGSLMDDGMARRAAESYARYLNPEPLPPDVEARLLESLKGSRL